jgi:predicted nuclease of predicted toxin-antitoxin system
MRITLDENLPARLVSVLAELGHDVDTVPSEHLAGRDDTVVWQTA